MNHSILLDSCDIQRRDVAPQGYGGKPRYAAAHATAVPCRLITKQQRGFNSVTGQWVTETQHTLLMRAGEDIQEGDQITNLVLRRDNTQDPQAKTDGTPLLFYVDGGAFDRRGAVTSLRRVSLRKVA